MKKKFLFFIPLMLIIYFNTPIHIKRHSWKNNGGGRISDFIIFDDTNYYELKWPYIYKDKEKTGIVFSVYMIVCGLIRICREQTMGFVNTFQNSIYKEFYLSPCQCIHAPLNLVKVHFYFISWIFCLATDNSNY